MVSKPVMLVEEAYNLLKEDKKTDESFSDVIIRTYKKKPKLSEVIGLWADIPTKEVDRIKDIIIKQREASVGHTEKKLGY